MRGTAPDAEPRLYAGGAGNTIDIQGYQRFLSACANDAAFTADNADPRDGREGASSASSRSSSIASSLIPIVRKRLKAQGEQYAWTGARPLWGPGRIDPFNPVKFGMLKLVDDGTIGNSDMLAVWNLAAREKIRSPTPYHWDGLSTSLRDVALSSALGDGAVAKEFNPDRSRASRDISARCCRRRRRIALDAAAATRGKALFAVQCAPATARAARAR